MDYAQGNLNLKSVLITDIGILVNQGVPATATIDDLPDEVTDDIITLKWSEPEDYGRVIIQYTVYQRIVTGSKTGGWIKLETTADSVTELTVKLESGKVYEFVVTATNEFGESLKEEGKVARVKASGGMCYIYISLKFTLVYCFANLTPSFLYHMIVFYTTRDRYPTEKNLLRAPFLICN